MANQQQLVKSRVVKVDSEESWASYIAQATSQETPVVVHFTASWCVPSLAMNPFFEELSLNYQDVLFLLVDVDELKEIASKLDVKAMPTFVLMKGETKVDQLVGANPEEMRKRVEAFVHTTRSN